MFVSKKQCLFSYNFFNRVILKLQNSIHETQHQLKDQKKTSLGQNGGVNTGIQEEASSTFVQWPKVDSDNKMWKEL